MGFYKETQAFEQKTQIWKTSNLQDSVKCMDNIESPKATNILESSTASNSSIFASIKALFTSTSIEQHAPFPSSERPRSQRPSQSSGYNSFTDSWDVDDSYVKVIKFSGM